MTHLIEARHLEVGYRVAGSGLLSPRRVLPIVRDLSFALMPGRTLGIVGESGCGKSTLGRALLCLMPVSGGQVLWQGQDMAALTAADLRARRSEMQIIFQDPVAALDPRMPIGRIVSRPLATFEPGLHRRDLNTRAIEALRQVGLSADFAGRYAHELSGGQAQRVGIARAIIGRPRLIVCDEPVSSLDVSIQAQIVNLLMDLQDQLGLALIFISHNLAVVRHISHEVMVMCLGWVVEYAPRDRFYARPLHPYSKALMQAVPEPDPLRERGRIGQSLPGELPSVMAPPPGCVFASRCPKVRDLCRTHRPELTEAEPGRKVACHFPEYSAP
jgi:oligopeptide transport system ATP-binding protein